MVELTNFGNATLENSNLQSLMQTRLKQPLAHLMGRIIQIDFAKRVKKGTTQGGEPEAPQRQFTITSMVLGYSKEEENVVKVFLIDDYYLTEVNGFVQLHKDSEKSEIPSLGYNIINFRVLRDLFIMPKN